nr:hypothetical protein KK1_011842 [Ipomoea batatas]
MGRRQHLGLHGPSLQQYCCPPKVVQGLLQPPSTFRAAGHWPLTSAVHEIAWHLSAPGLVGAKLKGMLKPSMSEMSMVSKLLSPVRVNSARVAGGLPHAVHCSAPPQSPVWHEPLPLASKLQFVRPHIRAIRVPPGTSIVQLWLWSSCLPPPTGVAAAQTFGLLELGTMRQEQMDNLQGAKGPHGPSVQQYCCPPKVVQGLLHPPGTLRAAGHWPLTSAVHEIAWHLSAPGLVGAKFKGTLNPSTSEMSMVSKLLSPVRVNSARVLGGLPQAVHCNAPPQSPVSHEPLPLASKLQFVRPHMRAILVPPGTSIVQLWP